MSQLDLPTWMRTAMPAEGKKLREVPYAVECPDHCPERGHLTSDSASHKVLCGGRQHAMFQVAEMPQCERN